MLRISRVVNNGTTVLRLEGRLLGPWVEALRAECAAADGAGRRRLLDLTSVTFLDAAGVRSVHDLSKRGWGVTGCSDFLSELLGAGQDGHGSNH